MNNTQEAKVILWIVGKVTQVIDDDHVAWEFGGVFDSEEKAKAACHKAEYFIAPYVLNVAEPDERSKMVGSYYPNGETQEEAAKRTRTVGALRDLKKKLKAAP
jgi:hypothetical protein